MDETATKGRGYLYCIYIYSLFRVLIFDTTTTEAEERNCRNCLLGLINDVYVHFRTGLRAPITLLRAEPERLMVIYGQLTRDTFVSRTAVAQVRLMVYITYRYVYTHDPRTHGNYRSRGGLRIPYHYYIPLRQAASVVFVVFTFTSFVPIVGAKTIKSTAVTVSYRY